MIEINCDNKSCVDISIGNVRLWFSYDTLIAFEFTGYTSEIIMSNKKYSASTSRHQASIKETYGNVRSVSPEDMNELLTKILVSHPVM